MKTVLFFDHTANLGGGEIALLRLVSYLNRKRFIPVVLLASKGRLHSCLINAGVETHLLPLDPEIINIRKESLGLTTLVPFNIPWKCYAYAKKLASFICNHRIDLIHTNSLKADLIGSIAAHISRIPIIWHIRDRIASDYLPSIAAIGFRTLCKDVPNHIIVNSKATHQTLGNVQATIVYDGVPVSTLTKLTEIPNNPLNIGLIGRISPWKGQHIFISAARIIHSQFPSVHFRIIGTHLFGEQSYEHEIHQLVHTLKLDDVIEFTGFRENIAYELEHLDIVVHASTVAEPLGQVILEAMHHSKPVIATNGGGVREIVIDNQTGLLIPMGDVNAMAGAIKLLLDNPCMAQQMGIVGRKRVLANFTIDQTAREIESVYEKVLNTHDPF